MLLLADVTGLLAWPRVLQQSSKSSFALPAGSWRVPAHTAPPDLLAGALVTSLMTVA